MSGQRNVLNWTNYQIRPFFSQAAVFYGLFLVSVCIYLNIIYIIQLMVFCYFWANYGCVHSMHLIFDCVQLVTFITTILKNRTMKISLFNYSILDYILPITSLPPMSVKKILGQPIFLTPQSKLITCLLAYDTGIFQTNLLLIIRDLFRCLQPYV